MGKLYQFEIGKNYNLKLINIDKIQVTPEGGRWRICRFDDISITQTYIDLYRRACRYHFEQISGIDMYRLESIDRITKDGVTTIAKTDEDEVKNTRKYADMTHEERIEQFKSKRVKKIENYIKSHWDEMMAVKCFCEVERVRNIENIRYEMRRLTGFGDIYNISIDEFEALIKRYGFKIGRR